MGRSRSCTTRNGCRGNVRSPTSLQCIDTLYRVTSSIFSADARFVLTGSEDGHVRIWKARASDKLGIITARERAAMEYRDSLKDRWKMDAEVGKVARCDPSFTFICIAEF